jgi:predicted peroxiredoxin
MNNTIFKNAFFEEIIAYYKANKTEKVSFARNRAIYAYRQTKDYELDTYTISETPFSPDMDDFMEMVNEAGITEFNLCEKSSGLMATLHYLLNNGWVVVGTYQQEIDRHMTLYGLRMKKQ